MDLTEVHTLMTENPRCHIGFRGFSISVLPTLCDSHTDQVKGPCRERGGPGSAGAEVAALIYADPIQTDSNAPTAHHEA